MYKKRIAFISAGLGNISRGFETSTALWFNQIKKEKELDVKLFSGGKYENAIKVWNIPRNGRFARLLRKVRIINDGCKLEQISFSVGFLFYLRRVRPNIIWLQEGILGSYLIKYRNLFGFKYKLIFCDGAPVGHEFAKRFDYIVFLNQNAMEEALKDGINAEKCAMIPLLTMFPIEKENILSARLKLNIDPNSFVIICVAAWNTQHKRIDYLLDEMSNISIPNTILLLCGQPEADADYLKEKANNLTNIEVRWYTLNQEDLSIAYLASDLFILTSINEGLGLVLIEAALHGLPVICHTHTAGKFIFGDNYQGLTNLLLRGNLSRKIMELADSVNLKDEGNRTKNIVELKFDRQKLILDFVNLINRVKP